MKGTGNIFGKSKTMRKAHASLLFILLACAVLAQSSFAAGPGGQKAEPFWWNNANTAVQQAQKSGKPVLLAPGLMGDLPSWEVRQRVFATDDFLAIADRFVLCRVAANTDDLKALKINVEAADVGGVIFLSPDGSEIERVRYSGDAALIFSVIRRVADGNSIAQLRKKTQEDPKNVDALKTLYSAFAERREATDAIETLAQLKAADADNAASYDALGAFWGIVILDENGRGAEALREIERLLPSVTDPAIHDELLIRKALLDFRLSDADSAVAALRKFIADNPNSPQIEKAYRTLFSMMMQAGRNDEAAGVLQEALRACPDSRFAIDEICRLALSLYSAGRYDVSRQFFALIADKVRGIAPCVQADIMYRSMAHGAEWKKRLAPQRKVLDVIYVVPDTATFLYYVSLWDDETYFPVLVNSGSEQDRRLIQRFAASFKPSRIIVAPARGDVKADEATAMRAVLASWNDNDLPAQGEVKPDDLKRALEKMGLAPMGIVFADSAADGLLAGGVALAAGRFEPLDFFHSDDAVSTVIKWKDAEKLRAEIADKIERWGYEYRHPFDDVDFVTFACAMPMKYEAQDWHEYNVDDFVTRREDEVRYAYPGRLMEGITRANYMAMCALFLQPARALFFNTYDPKREGFSEYKTGAAAVTMKDLMPVDHVGGADANIKRWRELMGRVNPYGYLHINSSGEKDAWSVAGGLGKLEDIPADSVPCVVQMTHSYSAAAPWDVKTIAGRWLNAGAYIYFGSNHEPFLFGFRTPVRIMAAIKDGEPLSSAFRPGFGERFWIPWRLCFMGDPMFVLTGKSAERVDAAKLPLGKDEKEVKDIREVFGKQE
jgi:tetratricopeptide (TPR) repeat protein